MIGWAGGSINHIRRSHKKAGREGGGGWSSKAIFHTGLSVLVGFTYIWLGGAGVDNRIKLCEAF